MALQATYSIPGFTEPFNSISHLLGAVIFLGLGVRLIFLGKGRTSRVISLTIFIFSGVFLLSMSGVYHLLANDGIGRTVLQYLDHAAIFVLIAGTFTPVHSILFTGWQRWGFLLLIWTIAIVGITLKSVFFNEITEWVGLLFYLGMGWVGALSGYLVYQRYGFVFLKFLLWGAFAYTLGAIMEYLRMPELIPGIIGPHELFHVAVLLGLGFHFMCIYKITLYDKLSPSLN